jgi:hypothetical protein
VLEPIEVIDDLSTTGPVDLVSRRGGA